MNPTLYALSVNVLPIFILLIKIYKHTDVRDITVFIVFGNVIIRFIIACRVEIINIYNMNFNIGL